MSDFRIKTLPGAAGSYAWDTRFDKRAVSTLTGNVTYAVGGMDDGDSATLFVTQDATAGRTLAFTFASGLTAVVLGADTAISAVAAKTTRVSLTRAGANVFVIYTLQA